MSAAFVPFLFELRAQKVKVGTQEAMALARALTLGLHDSSLDGFYHVARALCVHREGDLDSFDQAEEDLRQRQVIEARNEAQTILSALEKGKNSPAWEELSRDERARIEELERVLREAGKQEDYQATRKAIDSLNQGTMRLAELMMDTAVSSALKGKNMERADFGKGPDAPHPFGKAEFE